jgi:hypothetical protein
MAKNEDKVVETTKEVVEQPQKQEKAIQDSEVKPDAVIKTPKKLVKQEEDDVVKVDLRNNKEKENEEKPVEEVESGDEEKVEEEKVLEPIEESKEEVIEKTEEVEEPVLEEITSEEVEEKVEELKEEVEEAVEQAQQTAEPLPENIQKVVDFMNETGGSLEDYVKLNQDYSNHDDVTLLREYYKQTKPHLTDEEISFLMEDQFDYDEETDEDRDIKRKKLALKEQVAGAKSHLDGLKSKYYEEVKAGSKLTQDQQKAIDFFNRYNEELETTTKANDAAKSNFLQKTNQVFNDQFKGFEYKVGDKRYRFNVKNSDKVKETQSDINNFVNKFLDKNKNMNDAPGYHKSLFTAMNPDAVANHFYQQGKADAIKDSIAKSKNVSMDPRQVNSNVIPTSGFSARVVPGDSVSDFKVKIKK